MHCKFDDHFGTGVIELTILCLLPKEMLHTKFGKDWPSSS